MRAGIHNVRFDFPDAPKAIAPTLAATARERPVLVYRVADYHRSLAALRAAGLDAIEPFMSTPLHTLAPAPRGHP
jgi:hypothetical protein